MQKRPFKLEFPDAHPDALDLLDRMLQFDPRKRISVDDALNHPYIAPLRTPEPTAPSDFIFQAVSKKSCSIYVRYLPTKLDTIWP